MRPEEPLLPRDPLALRAAIWLASALMPNDDSTRAPHMLIVGSAPPVGDALARQAELMGWSTTTAADVDTCLAVLGELGPGDSVIVLEHQHRVATPVLAAALRSNTGYVGA